MDSAADRPDRTADDFRDFLVLSANFGGQGGWADGDLDGDGVVGLSDFVRLSAAFARD